MENAHRNRYVVGYKWIWIFSVSAMFSLIFGMVRSAQKQAAPFGPLPDWLVSFQIDADRSGRDFSERQVGELFVKIETVLASDGQEGDNFGASVAISGNTAVVGAPYDDDLGSQVGAAYIFFWDINGQTWIQVKKIYPSEIVSVGNFGGQVRIDGDTVAIAGNQYFSNPFEAVFVFERDQGGSDNWGQVKKLTPSSSTSTFGYGVDLQVDGDLIVVSSYQDNVSPDHNGSAFIYQQDNGGLSNWGEVVKLTAPEPDQEKFSHGVSISGNRVAIGSTSPGAVFIFEQDAGGPDNWGFVKKVEGSDVENGEFFASQLTIAGDELAVTAAFGNAVYIFHKDQGGPGNWGEVAKISGEDFDAWVGYPGMSFIDQGRLFVHGIDSEDSFGKVVVLERDSGGVDNWGVEQIITPEVISTLGADDFGRSISGEGERLMFGQSNLEINGTLNVGAAHYYGLATQTPTPTVTPSPSSTPSPTATATSTPTATPSMADFWSYLPVILKLP